MALLGIAMALWLALCIWMYRAMRSAKWLAGSSVASCAFFLGAAAACGFFASRAVLLVPVALAVALLLIVHAWSAQGGNAAKHGDEDEAVSAFGDGPSVGDMQRTTTRDFEI